jgi:hypothetical protein
MLFLSIQNSYARYKKEKKPPFGQHPTAGGRGDGISGGPAGAFEQKVTVLN